MGKALMLAPIAAENIPAFLPSLIAILTKAPNTWEDYSTPEGIARSVLRGGYRLWVGFEGREPKLFVLTSVVKYDEIDVAYVEWAGGEMVKEFLPFLTFIEEWAMQNGCSRLEIKGRVGWAKLLASQGYHQSHVVLSKNLIKTRGN